MNMTRRLLLLALALALSISAVVPVTAAAAESADWIELLEFTSIDDSGSNTFTFTTTANVVLPLHQSMRLRKLDILFTCNSGQQPNKIAVTAAGSTFELTILRISGTTFRAVGYIPNTVYSSLRITFTKTTSSQQTYHLLSCKVSPLGQEEVVADADLYFNGAFYELPNDVITEGTAVTPTNLTYTARINVYDWQKFDYLTIWGSVTQASMTSVRATLSTAGLPFTINYMDTSSIASWSEWVADYGGDTGAILEMEFYGDYLYCITIDLANVDRTLTDPLYIYIRGAWDAASAFTFTCMYVNGGVSISDTANVSWWTRFTTFMRELFGGDSAEADDFKTDMEQQGQEVQDAADQIDSVTRPPLDDVDVDLGVYVDAAGTAQAGEMFGQLFDNALVLPMVMISLLVALAAFVIFGKR